MAFKERQRPLDEPCHGRRLFVGVQLDVGESGVIVDDRVGVVGADAGVGVHPAPRVLGAIAGDGVAGALEAQ